MTAVEFLAKRYEHISMSNISRAEADKLRAEALEQAKELWLKQLGKALHIGYNTHYNYLDANIQLDEYIDTLRTSEADEGDE